MEGHAVNADLYSTRPSGKRLCCIGGHSKKSRNIMLCKAGLNVFRYIFVYRRAQCKIEIYKVVYRRAQA